MPTYIFPGTQVSLVAGQQVTTISGSITQTIVAAFISTLAGNTVVSLGAGVVWLFKTAIITTDATVANRRVGAGTNLFSSKVVAASQTGADLLDREVVVTGSAGIDFQVINGAAGDTWWATRLQLK